MFRRSFKNFEKKYGRALVGKLLGQFHTDFDIFEAKRDIEGRQTGHGKAIECEHITSIDFIALGKKAYINHLVGVRKDNGEMVQDYHLRMKGVSSASIWHKLQTKPSRDVNDPGYEQLSNEPDTFENPLELCRYLYNGNSLTFDLTCSSTKGSFDMCSNLTVESRSEFLRTVSFQKGQLVRM